MKNLIVKFLVALTIITSIGFVDYNSKVEEAVSYPDGYRWEYGYDHWYNYTWGYRQYSIYDHGKKSHSATELVDNAYDKDSQRAGVRASTTNNWQ